MATWLAADELDFHGAVAVASGWLQRASRLLEPLEDGPDHGGSPFTRGTSRKRWRHEARAEAGGRRGRHRPAVRRPRPRDARARTRGRGAGGAGRGRGGNALPDEATTTALAARPRSRSRAPGLVASSSPRVPPCATSIVPSSGATASPSSRNATGAATCSASAGRSTVRAPLARALGRRRRAARELDRGLRASRPAYAAGPMVQLAELRRRQGRPAEAARLLEGAGTSEGAQLGRARLAFDAGDAQTAVELLEGVRRRTSGPREIAAWRGSSLRRSPSTTSIVPPPRSSSFARSHS